MWNQVGIRIKESRFSVSYFEIKNKETHLENKYGNSFEIELNLDLVASPSILWDLSSVMSALILKLELITDEFKIGQYLGNL